MRVAFPFNADQVGGSSKSSFLLLEKLASQDVQPVLMLHGNGPLLDDAIGLGIEFVQLPELSGRPTSQRPDRFHPANWKVVPLARHILRTRGIDIVHVNDLSMLRTWFPTKALNRSKFVVHWRSNYSSSLSVNAGLLASDRIISISMYGYNALPRWAQRRTLIEYNPTRGLFSDDLRRSWRATVRSELNIPQDAAIIGVFGSHTVRKRTHILADILMAVTHTASGRPVYGLACGQEAEPRDTLLPEKIRRYGLANRILLPGFVSPAERWMAACDVIIAPSVREPFGRAVFEAGQVAVPLVMTADSGAAELIERYGTGMLIEPNDAAAWTRACRDLLNNSALSARLLARNAEMLEEYSIGNHATRIAQIYRDLHSPVVR